MSGRFQVCPTCLRPLGTSEPAGRMLGSDMIVTVKRIAQAVGVSRATIYRWMRSEPQIPVVYFCRYARIAPEELGEYLARRAEIERKKRFGDATP